MTSLPVRFQFVPLFRGIKSANKLYVL